VVATEIGILKVPVLFAACQLELHLFWAT